MDALPPQKLPSLIRSVGWLLAVLLLPCSAHAEDKPNYACPHLGDKSRQTLSAMTQGRDGWFFRENNLQDPVILESGTREYLTRLHQAFRDKGAELLVLSVPPRALVVSETVLKDQPMQELFDAGIAGEEYGNFVKDMRQTGIPVVALLEDAIAANKDGDRFFFPRDIHWTPLGSSLAAQKVGELLKTLPGYSAEGLSQYVSRPEVESRIPYRSKMAEEIQHLCTDEIPQQMFMQYVTTQEAGGNTADALFGDSSQPPLVLLGTSFSKEKAYNFEGFLSEHTGMEVANLAISAGGLFNSIISYTSLPEDKRLNPKFVLWEELPYYNYNDSNAYRQLIPAIYGECSKEQAVASAEFSFDPAHTQFSLDVPAGTGVAGKDYFVFVSTPVLDLNKFTLELDQADGDGEWNTIDRSDHFDNTGRFFFELNDELAAPLTRITIGSLPALQGSLEIRLCRYPGSATPAPTKISSLPPQP